MAITYKEVRNDRQWKASTGLSEKQFFLLVKQFAQSYEQILGISMYERQNNSTNASTFKTYEDLLFFTLYSLKSGLTYDLLGLTFGLDRANAYQNQSMGIGILRGALNQGGYLPKRSYQQVEAFKQDWLEQSEILIDATEQRMQRPLNEQDQKQNYSGKKKAHTSKFLILANDKKQIKFLSKAYCGSAHDYAILKSELPPKEQCWFDQHHLHVDLGFLGIAKDYKSQKVSIPLKKSKNNPLTQQCKKANKNKSSIRVKVEHCIGGMKRYRFMADRLRCHNVNLYNLAAGVCAGLWNFYLTN